MKVDLKEFQTHAVWDLMQSLADMKYDYETRNRLTSICLSAPTGSGKTVMCAAAIEALFFGDDENGFVPDENATILWVSDSPSLNDQTRARFVQASDKLANWITDERYMEVIGNDFCASHDVLERRHLYFISKDLLGRGNLLTRGGEQNSGRVFWDVLDRTIRDPERNLYLFIDEAHRGLGANTSSESGSATIYANLIDGFEGRSAAPIVVGISATPERFEASMAERTERVRMPRVEVTPKEVQESGLLKDTIELRIPEKDDPVEHQYLTMACERFVEAQCGWSDYCKEQDERPVAPLLVIQVHDRIGNDELMNICERICELVPGLTPAGSFAHVFGTHADIQAGRYVIPYVEPEYVQERPVIEVLFAKEAVSNGWDCPRAEVIYSQRRRSDATYIAQLIGRMVRTPLARRIDSNEMLNSVACYLPQFNPEATQGVVDYLTGKGDEFGGTYVPKVITDPVVVAPANPRTEEDYQKEVAQYKASQTAEDEGSEQTSLDVGDREAVASVVEVAEEAATAENSTETDEACAADGTNEQKSTEAIAQEPAQPVLPPKPLTKRDASFTKEEWRQIREAFDSIIVQRNIKKPRNEFKSLLDTATLLAETNLDRNACGDVNKGFAGALAGSIIKYDEDYRKWRYEVEVAETQVITIDRLNDNDVSTRSEIARADEEGVRRAAHDAVLRFGGKELVNAYRLRLIMEEGESEYETNLRLAAAVRTEKIVSELEDWAASKRREYFDAHDADRDFLDEADRQRYDRLAEETEGRRTVHIEWPSAHVASSSWERFPKHIVQDDEGLCPLDLDKLERYVLRKELDRERTVAFYRNPSNNSPQVFSIPYTAANGRKSLRPDFIFFVRGNDGKICPTIIDPHGTHLADTVARLKGYVAYLRDYPDVFKQVLSIGTLDGSDEYRALNLLKHDVQEAILNFGGDMGEELFRDPSISSFYGRAEE